jgi:uncharacterized protein (DUF4415 family)
MSRRIIRTVAQLPKGKVAELEAFDDNPEWTEDDFARARPADVVHGPEIAGALKRRRGRPPKEDRKEAISIRLSPEVLEFFRRHGGWQATIDELLKGYVRSFGDERVLLAAFGKDGTLSSVTPLGGLAATEDDEAKIRGLSGSSMEVANIARVAGENGMVIGAGTSSIGDAWYRGATAGGGSHMEVKLAPDGRFSRRDARTGVFSETEVGGKDASPKRRNKHKA